MGNPQLMGHQCSSPISGKMKRKLLFELKEKESKVSKTLLKTTRVDD